MNKWFITKHKKNNQNKIKMKQLTAFLSLTLLLCTIQMKVSAQVNDIDGHIYKTAKIGTQTWMVENLNVGHFRNGDAIPELKEVTAWKIAGRMSKAGWYNNHTDTSNRNKYGKLYNGHAVGDDRGLAPAGWHVATDADWATLIDYLGGPTNAGTKMKSTTAWDSSGNGNNKSGFSGLPVGFRSSSDGSTDLIGIEGTWWSSTDAPAFGFRWCYILIHNKESIERSKHKNGAGMSVRCVKD